MSGKVEIKSIEIYKELTVNEKWCNFIAPFKVIPNQFIETGNGIIMVSYEDYKFLKDNGMCGGGFVLDEVLQNPTPKERSNN